MRPAEDRLWPQPVLGKKVPGMQPDGLTDRLQELLRTVTETQATQRWRAQCLTLLLTAKECKLADEAESTGMEHGNGRTLGI